mmetsp:Transcript_39648/g.51960  ORF Transcript_39648/g.51960 Transcript_39648/m.51960 type:complete len:137 (+) Transcript_39648:324-734(+)
MLIAFCLLSEASMWTFWFQVYLVVTEVSMTTATLLAMRHIHKSSQQLEEMGIRKNGVIMKLYIGFWASCTVISIVIIGLNLAIHYSWNSWSYERVALMTRMNTALLILTLLQFLNIVCLDSVILLHYWKAGDTLRN